MVIEIEEKEKTIPISSYIEKGWKLVGRGIGEPAYMELGKTAASLVFKHRYHDIILVSAPDGSVAVFMRARIAALKHIKTLIEKAIEEEQASSEFYLKMHETLKSMESAYFANSIASIIRDEKQHIITLKELHKVSENIVRARYG